MFFPFDLCFVVGSWICLSFCLVALPVNMQLMTIFVGNSSYIQNYMLKDCIFLLSINTCNMPLHFV